MGGSPPRPPASGCCWVQRSDGTCPRRAGAEPHRRAEEADGVMAPRCSRSQSRAFPPLPGPRGIRSSLVALPSGAGTMAGAPACPLHLQGGEKKQMWMHSHQTKRRGHISPHSSYSRNFPKFPNRHDKAALGEWPHLIYFFWGEKKKKKTQVRKHFLVAFGVWLLVVFFFNE